ncbi:unnamed protein product [Cunninghamella echinulata]
MQLFKVCSMFVMMMALSQMDSMVSATSVGGTTNKPQPPSPPGQTLPNIYRRAGDDVSADDCKNRKEDLNQEQLQKCKDIEQGQQVNGGIPVPEVGETAEDSKAVENGQAPAQNKRNPPPAPPTSVPPTNGNGGSGAKSPGPVKKRAIDHFYKRGSKQGKSGEHGKEGSGGPGAPSGPGAQKRNSKQDPPVNAQKEDAPSTGAPGTGAPRKGSKVKPSTPGANPQKREKPEADKSGKKAPKPDPEAGKKSDAAAED